MHAGVTARMQTYLLGVAFNDTYWIRPITTKSVEVDFDLNAVTAITDDQWTVGQSAKVWEYTKLGQLDRFGPLMTVVSGISDQQWFLHMV